MCRFWAIVIVGLSLMAGSSLVVESFSVEPIYASRRLSQWLDAGAEPAVLAVHEIGPTAAPWILQKVRNEHPQWGLGQTYGRRWRQLPGWMQRVAPKPPATGFDEFRAATLLVAIGPQVIPQLRAGLRASSPAVRISCALALRTFRQAGKRDARTLAALRVALQDPQPEIRDQAAQAIAAGESRR